MGCRPPRRSLVSPARSRRPLASPCRSGSPSTSFSQDRLRSRQAARLRGARRHRGGRVLAPKPVTLIFASEDVAATAWRATACAHRGPARASESELRRRYGVEGARLARLPAVSTTGRSGPSARPEHFGGNHLRPRHCRLPSAGAAAVAPRRESLRPAQDQCARRLDRTLKLKTAISASAPGPVAQPPHPARRAIFAAGPTCSHAKPTARCSPDRHRLSASAMPTELISPTSSTAAAPRPSSDRPAARTVRR